MKSLQKLIALCASTVLFASYGTSAFAIGDVGNDDERWLIYHVYDADSNTQYTDRTYTLSATTSTSVSSRIVIGNTDSREVDFSKSGVVKLIYGDSFGTGFVVDSHVIATAGHCAMHAIDSILLFNSDGTVALSATPIERHVPYEYEISADDHEYYNDYGLITVEEDLTDYIQFNLGIALDQAIMNNQAVSVTGFPGMVQNATVNTPTVHGMYTGSGTLVNSNSSTDCSIYRLKYDADTSGGNSGGPVYVTTTYGGNTYYTAIAIHTTSGNSGVRMNRDVICFYLNNPNIEYS
ncbi:MAG: serine protease [Oscillospiraceae bacterium]|nr:serine protease [Oscillospiraceae bacterium]